jgi:hypothetical protein
VGTSYRRYSSMGNAVWSDYHRAIGFRSLGKPGSNDQAK